MDLPSVRKDLSANSAAIKCLLENVTPEQAAFRPEPERWTILETVNHLADIEVEDFRRDLEIVLFHPEKPWPQFSIEAWRVEKKYNERDWRESEERFFKERARSLEWLGGLKRFDPEARHSGNGFKGEAMRAGDVLASWGAHDLFHLRQLALGRWFVLSEWAKPFSPQYSGFEF